MSFIAVAVDIFGEGLAANIAAGALMGGSITIGSNVLRGKNPFDNIGQGLILGGLTAGISNGLGNSLSAAGVTETAAQEAVTQGTLTPDLAGQNPYALGNSVETSAIPAPPSATPGGLESLVSQTAPVPVTEMPITDQYLEPEIGSREYLANESGTIGSPANAAPSASTTPDISSSSAAPPTTTNPADFGRNHISPASDYQGTLRSSGLPSLSQVGQFAKDNWKSLAGIAAIGLLSQPKPTTSGSGQKQGYIRPASYDPYSGKYTYYDPIKTQDYTHAKHGGLMGLANGGAVAFADGGPAMTSPYMNAINNPKTIPLMSGETQEQGLARMQAQQTELDERNKRRMEAAGQQAPETINYTQSPAGLNPSSPTVQTQADVDYWTQRTAAAQNSPFSVGGGGSPQGSGGQSQVDYIRSLMADNPAPVGPTNAQMMAAQEQERAELAARRAAVSTGGDGFVVTGPNSPQPVIPRPDVSAVSGPPIDRATATGIQSLPKPEMAATTTAAPSGIQMVHGSIYDPVTGRFRNPTEAELGLKAIQGARDNINTTSEMTQLTNQYFDSYKAGEVLDFAGGTLTKNADGTATHKYTDANGKEQTYTFSRGTDIATIANSDPAIANEWKGMFNYTPPARTGSPIISTPGPTYPSVPAKTGSPIISTPGPTYPSVPIGGGGGPGQAVQNPTGFTPTPAPPTRVPTSIKDFNTRFNTQTEDSKAQYDYLMGNGPEPKQTQNAEVMKPYWEAMGTTPVDKTRSEFMYDPTTKKYVKNPDYVKKVINPTTKRLVPEVTATDNKDKKPTTPPDSGMEWTWDDTKKQWAQTAIADDTGNGQVTGNSANGGLMHAYAGGGLGSLGGYSDGGRLLRGPGDGVSDSIPASIGNRQPARLADGEFVVPARIVSELGNGSTEAGARRLYAMMDRVQNARKKSVGKGNVAKNSRAEQYLPA